MTFPAESNVPLVESIMSAHLLEGKVRVGEFVTLKVDRIYIQDGNTPTIARLAHENRLESFPEPNTVGVFFDHSVLATTGATSTRLREAFEFANSNGFCVFESGRGISHVVAIEEDWFSPRSIVVGADSHTCTGGVNQSLALGLGASDVLASMVLRSIWAKVPMTNSVLLVGKPGKFTGAKDVMLYLAARFGPNTFVYQSLEWSGEWIEQLSLDQASTVANMSVELGAKCAFIAPSYRRGQEHLRRLGTYENRKITVVNIDALPPHVAPPHSPYDAVEIERYAGQRVQYVFVGSCANSRMEDLLVLESVLRKSKVHRGVHLVVTPGSRQIYLSALENGTIASIVRAGGLVTPPGCGPCVGTQGSIPADGDNVVSTMNRNFLGRMGNPKARIWLASPLVAANAAILGKIPREEEIVL